MGWRLLGLLREGGVQAAHPPHPLRSLSAGLERNLYLVQVHGPTVTRPLVAFQLEIVMGHEGS